jgi:hypothetical protein
MNGRDTPPIRRLGDSGRLSAGRYPGAQNAAEPGKPVTVLIDLTFSEHGAYGSHTASNCLTTISSEKRNT